MIRYAVVNLGQVQPRARGPACPTVVEGDPKLNCALTRDGGVLCSDGRYYPPGCPSPKVTAEADYQKQGGALVPVTPPEFSLTKEVGEGFPYVALAIAGASAVVTLVVS